MRRRLVALLGVVLVASIVATTPAHAGKPKHVLRDLHYGDTLFYFYQQKYFSAITRLMAYGQGARLTQSSDESELLQGGMYLSYGMHREAELIFERLIAAGAPQSVQDRAWFYLAKIRYQRGMDDDAATMLARVKGALPAELDAERRVLTGLIATRQERYNDAIAALKSLRGNSSWTLYARYNLGVALARAGRLAESVDILEQVGLKPDKADDDETQSLRDKANVALGFLFLRENQTSRALAYLNAVRLNGPLSSRALLGLGWADIEAGDAKRALVPWQELTQRDRADSAVQEAWLAVPYAYGVLGAYRQSLEHYERAIAVLRDETISLDQAVAAIHDGQLVNGMLARNPEEEMGWFWRVQELPNAPETHYLVDLLASHEFNEALKLYRDLRFIEHNLEAWAKNIEIYDTMLANRRIRYGKMLPRIEKELARHELAPLVARRDALSTELATIESNHDVAALATPAERARAQRIGRLTEQLKRAPTTPENEPDNDALREKLRQLLGVQTWDLWAAYPARRWQVQKALTESSRQLDDANERRTTIEQARLAGRASFDGYTDRIEAGRARIHALRASTRAAAVAQGQTLETLAIAELKLRRARLVTYLTQAQFAVAQIYDKAALVEPAP